MPQPVHFNQSRLMSANLQMTPKSRYLLAVVTGECSLPEAKDHFTQILAACREQNLSSTVVDVRDVIIRDPMTTMKRFEFAEFLARTAGGGVSVAYVGSKAHVDPRGFGETVARNRGLNLKITTDMADALAWIES
jgi:hypothetical protein